MHREQALKVKLRDRPEHPSSGPVDAHADQPVLQRVLIGGVVVGAEKGWRVRQLFSKADSIKIGTRVGGLRGCLLRGVAGGVHQFDGDGAFQHRAGVSGQLAGSVPKSVPSFLAQRRERDRGSRTAEEVTKQARSQRVAAGEEPLQIIEPDKQRVAACLQS